MFFKILAICYKYFNCRIIYICEIGIKNNNSKNSFGFYALRKRNICSINCIIHLFLFK